MEFTGNCPKHMIKWRVQATAVLRRPCPAFANGYARSPSSLFFQLSPGSVDGILAAECHHDGETLCHHSAEVERRVLCCQELPGHVHDCSFHSLSRWTEMGQHSDACA